MSMPKADNKARAVVGISAVHLLKWADGAEPEITSGIFSSSSTQQWFTAAVIKGSVELTQDNTSINTVHVEGMDAPIGISTEAGDFNVSFSMPKMESSYLEKWLDKDSTSITIADSNSNSRQGYGYDFKADLINTVLAIETQTGDWLVFPNVEGSVAFGIEDNVAVLKYQGAVLAASNANNKTVYVFADSVSAS